MERNIVRQSESGNNAGVVHFLMRRGAFAYQSSESDAELAALADAAKGAADRAGSAIDDALDLVLSQ